MDNLEKGVWYKRPIGTLIIIEESHDVIIGSGFDSSGNWIDSIKCGRNYSDWTRATEDEVCNALGHEAIKRGFIEGNEYRNTSGGKTRIRKTSFKYSSAGRVFSCNSTSDEHHIIFNRINGWRSVIESEKVELDLEEEVHSDIDELMEIKSLLFDN